MSRSAGSFYRAKQDLVRYGSQDDLSINEQRMVNILFRQGSISLQEP